MWEFELQKQRDETDKFLKEIRKPSDLDLRTALKTDLYRLDPDLQFLDKNYRRDILKVMKRLFYDNNKFAQLRFMNKFAFQENLSSGASSTSLIASDYFIIKTSKKSLLEYPHEAVVGYFLNKLRDQGIYNFMYTYIYFNCGPEILINFRNYRNFTWCDTSIPGSFLILERLNGKNYKYTDYNQEQNLSISLQLIFALLCAYQAFKFTHNDLHQNNIVIVKTKLNVVSYNLYGKTFYIPTYGVIPVIIDYGRVYINYDNKSFGAALNSSREVEYFANTGFYIDRPNIAKDLAFPLTFFGNKVNNRLTYNLDIQKLLRSINSGNFPDIWKQYIFNLDKSMNLSNKILVTYFYNKKNLPVADYTTVLDYLDEWINIWKKSPDMIQPLNKVYGFFEGLSTNYARQFPKTEFLSFISSIPNLGYDKRKIIFQNIQITLSRIKFVDELSLTINPRLLTAGKLYADIVSFSNQVIYNNNLQGEISPKLVELLK